MAMVDVEQAPVPEASPEVEEGGEVRKKVKPQVQFSITSDIGAAPVTSASLMAPVKRKGIPGCSAGVYADGACVYHCSTDTAYLHD